MWWAEHGRGIYYLSSGAYDNMLFEEWLCQEQAVTTKQLNQGDIPVAFIELTFIAKTFER
jgi:hypothetical protein